MQRKDLTYQTFGRLFVICPTESKKGHWHWWCHCECGNFVEVESHSLNCGNTESCGCLQVDKASEANYVHGQSRDKNTPYESWKGMRERVYNPRFKQYHNYGGKGVKICSEWESYDSFYTWALSHGWKKGLTIDRIDSNGNYCPENCEWVTRGENSFRRNEKRKSI